MHPLIPLWFHILQYKLRTNDTNTQIHVKEHVIWVFSSATLKQINIHKQQIAGLEKDKILGIRPQQSCHICSEHNISRNDAVGAVNSPQTADNKQAEKHNKLKLFGMVNVFSYPGWKNLKEFNWTTCRVLWESQ